MTKDNNDHDLEKYFLSDNNYWKNKNRRTVFIPRRVGRKNPGVIRTDSFDFAKILDTVQNVGKQVESVSNTVKNVSGAVSGAVNQVKGTVNQVKQLGVNTQTVPGYPAQSQQYYQQPTYYPQPQPQQQPKTAAAPNFLLTDTIYGIPLPFALMSAALIVYIIIKLARK